MTRTPILLVVSFMVCLACGPTKEPAKVSRSAPPSPPAVPIRRHDPPPVPTPVPPARPNILLITLDTVRYDATGLAPQALNRTPFLRRIAADGIEFTRSYSTFDSTPQSHFSMLTGFVNGWGVQPYDLKENSVAYQLSKYGYSTFGIVANGNLSPEFSPDVQGFRSYTWPADMRRRLTPAANESWERWINARIRHYGATRNEIVVGVTFASAPMVLQRFEKRISTIKPPFFGFLNFIDAHDPYFPDPATYDAEAEERGIRPPGFVSDLRVRPMLPEILDPQLIKDEKKRAFVVKLLTLNGHPWSTTFDLDRDAIRVYRKRYWAEVRQLDAALRKVFDTLAAKNLLDSTVVIITSDHGEAFGENHLLTHSFNNEGPREATHRVPLVIALPASYGIRSRKVGVPTSSADIAPTIYDLVGLDWTNLSEKVAPGAFGKSLLPYFGVTLSDAEREAVKANGRPVPSEEWLASRKKAEETLRSLGYLH